MEGSDDESWDLHVVQGGLSLPPVRPDEDTDGLPGAARSRRGQVNTLHSVTTGDINSKSLILMEMNYRIEFC